MKKLDLYAEWLKKLSDEHDDPFIRQSEEMLAYFFELLDKTQSSYGWRVADEDVLNVQLHSVDNRTVSEINSVYWHDMARRIEAHDIVLVWRSGELAKDCLDLLNRKHILAPALCARALLELACFSLWNTNTINKTVKNAIAASIANNSIIVCEELEKLVVKMLHGTRLGNPPEHLKQTNILTYIQKSAKNSNAAPVQGIYEFLCDVTHPNVLGNARFWAFISSTNKDGSVTLRMEREAEGPSALDIREKILWALGWSGACVRNAFLIGQDAVRQIMTKWPDKGAL